MRLADDRRGRVPFTLVAALLLVTSASFAATAGQWREPATTTAADRAAAQATADARIAVERAATAASVAAAREPVVDATPTRYGRVLDDAEVTPFRAALRLRTYLAVRDALRPVRADDGRTTARVSAPPVETPADVRRAIRHVDFDPGPEPRTARVTVQNLTLVLRQDGRVVARDPFEMTVLVGTPVLRLHGRVARFERRLARPLLAGPGLDRRLTAGLFEVVTARGYAQYAGAPVANVLANRHVALATNAALLHEQRRVFGRNDPATLVGVRRAGSRTLATDLVAGAKEAGWAPRHLPDSPGRTGSRAPTASLSPDVAADRAFLGFLDGTGDCSLRGTLAAAYAVEARLVVRVRHLGTTERPVSEARHERSISVVPAAVAAPPGAPPVFHPLANFGRRVTVRSSVERENGTFVRVRRSLVTVGVFGRHAGGSAAPVRPIAGAHEPGGLLDGPNFADVEARAVARLVESRGGVDAVARRAARGDVPAATVTVRAARPTDLRERAVREAVRVREQVRALDIRGPARRLAVDANPTALLLRRFDARRAALVDAPVRYDGASDRALAAVRSAYLDAVRARLAARVDRIDALQTRLRQRFEAPAAEALSGEAAVPGMENRATAVAAVRASPAYLSLAAVPAGRVPGVVRRYHPLAARNRNVFTLPYGDAVDTVLDGVVGRESGTASLATAAQTLRAANATLRWSDRPRPELVRSRDPLQRGVAGALDEVEGALRDGVREATVPLGPTDRRVAVSAGMGAWETVDGRALAAVNGSLAGAVAAAVDRRAGLGPTARDVLEVRLRVALADVRATARVRVAERAVSRVPPTVRAEATAAAGNLTQQAVDRAAARRWGTRLGFLPAGLPVAPVPGYWYATVNVWRVSVAGEYARFVVRDGGVVPTAAPNGTLRYVREDAAVRLDVDGDGTADRLGWNRRVSFDVETTVVVAVPPGPRGVGDTDGNADERSAGWGSATVSRVTEKETTFSLSA